MRIAIVGLGRMGSVAAATANAAGHEVTLRVDPNAEGADAPSFLPEHAERCDQVIEFSTADAVVDNARSYAAAGVPAVVGTTGWNDRLSEVEAIVSAGGSGYLYAANCSIGMHVFMRVVARAASLFDALPAYDAAVYEHHHRRKADSPSGTALAVADAVLGASSRKQRVATERLDRPIDEDELHVASIRGGEEPGTHTVLFDSREDTVELVHRARGREALAVGALRLAEWLQGRTGFFTIEHFLADLLPEA